MSDNTLGILIIVGIIAIGIFSGGAIFNGSPQTKNTPANTQIYGSNSTYTPPSETELKEEQKRYELEMQIAQAREQVRLLQIEVANNAENQSASIYKGKVDLIGISNPGSLFGYVEILSTAYGQDLNITGWKIQSTISNNEQVIGGAANLPHSGASTDKEVVLPTNGRVVLSQITSPIGYSFRVNKCTGYFGQASSFLPNLNRNCPLAKNNAPQLSNGFNSACLDYIDRIPSCTVPQESDIPETINLVCKNYLLTQINYDSCVAHHKNDVDFYSNEWRLYPKTVKLNWLERHESLQLLDSTGRVVDTYTY
jgi:hypothetical protein